MVKENTIFTNVLKKLHEQGISHCLLRVENMDSFEDCELDLLVWPKNADLFRSVMAELNFNCWKSRSFLKKEVYACFDGRKLYLLDVHYALIQNGIEYANLSGIEDRLTVINDAFPVLSAEDQLLHYFYHNLLGKKHLQTKHVSMVKSLLSMNLDKKYIQEKIGDQKIYSIFKSFVENPTSFTEKSPHNQKSIHWLKHRLTKSSLKNRLRNIYKKLVSPIRRRPKGIHYAILGVDGAGKSSLIEGLSQNLGQLKGVKHKVVYMGPWGQSLSGLRKWVMKHQISLPREEDSLNEKKPSRRWLGQFLNPRVALSQIKKLAQALIYYGSVYFELWYRYLTEVRPLLRKGRIVLSDRYVYDLRHIYKKRPVYKYNLVRYLICQFFPQPDRIVFLYNDPETIVSRKPQLDAAEIELFQSFYLDTLEKYNPMLIKTDRGVEELSADVLNDLFKNLFNRKNSKSTS